MLQGWVDLGSWGCAGVWLIASDVSGVTIGIRRGLFERTTRRLTHAGWAQVQRVLAQTV